MCARVCENLYSKLRRAPQRAELHWKEVSSDETERSKVYWLVICIVDFLLQIFLCAC